MDYKEALQYKTWAVAGASNHKEKFGWKLYQCLKGHDYEVYPVNPGLTEIDGEKCFASLKELPIVPDVVDVVVPAKIGVETVREAAGLGVKAVWLQPGADKPEVIAAAHECGIEVICDCVLQRLQHDKEN